MPPAPRQVVLDANVLYSFLLRDTILRAAEEGLCLPYWSAEILDEMIRNLVANGKVKHQYAPRLLEGFRKAFPESLVTGYEHRLAQLENEEKDRHVVAVALHAGIQTIVTANLHHFEPLPTGIRAISPDECLLELLESSPETMFGVLLHQVADFKRPPVTYEGLLLYLERQAPEFVMAVRTLQGRTR